MTLAKQFMTIYTFIVAPKAHFHPGESPPTTVQRFWSVRDTLTGAVRSDIQTLYRHTKLLKIAMNLDLG